MKCPHCGAMFNEVQLTTKVERNEEICRLRASGLKLKEIADRYSISAPRVRMIVKRQERNRAAAGYQAADT